MIRGIWAEDAHTLNPEQWVNVYEVGVMDDAVFQLTCQVKELPDLIDLKMADYCLEPTEEG
jgi:hypothetical protein